MIDSNFKKCLVECFSESCIQLNVISPRDEFIAGGTPFVLPFDVISGLVSRFWTADFLDDLVVNVGSGVYVNSDFLIDFARRFWNSMTIQSGITLMEVPGTSSDSLEEHRSPQAAIISRLAEVLYNDLVSMTTGVSLLPFEKREYHTPVSFLKAPPSPLIGRKEISDFLLTNNWLVPFYLLFITGCYTEVRTAMTQRID